MKPSHDSGTAAFDLSRLRSPGPRPRAPAISFGDGTSRPAETQPGYCVHHWPQAVAAQEAPEVPVCGE